MTVENNDSRGPARWKAIALQPCPACIKQDILIVLMVGAQKVVECPGCLATFSVRS